MENGVPPISPDRLAYRRFQRRVFAGGIVATVGLALAFLHFGSAGDAAKRQELIEGFAQQEYGDPKTELEEVHQAARDFVSDYLAKRGARALQWPETPRHEGHHGWYFIEGLVDVRDTEGEKLRLLYQVRLALREEGGWERESIELMDPPTSSEP